ncbi:MAG TPA: hypothetical protein VGJ60_28415 [Chloroflexota bacterium]|jgi:hypothetical protein
MPTPTEYTRDTVDAALHVFSPHELSRLMSVEATLAAEHYLVPLGQPCADHQACRRLAFGLWLRLTNRVAEEIEIDAAIPVVRS